MVVVHRYKPQWQDELELSPGDVILVLSKHEEGRWFGRLQNGQQGYFPASCVMELGQVGRLPLCVQQCSITGLFRLLLLFTFHGRILLSILPCFPITTPEKLIIKFLNLCCTLIHEYFILVSNFHIQSTQI